jgi:DNA-binding NarL/FixJ family response regulator
MKFILVDDHFLVREALRSILRELDDNATILEASRWRDASLLLEECSDVSLLLLDLGLPDRDGFVVLEEIRKRHPDVPVVILSGNCNRGNVLKALDLGAAGFIPKAGERAVMLSALRLIFSGGVYIPPEILLPRELPAAPVSLTASSGPNELGSTSPADYGLTARQVDVLALMVRGKTNKAICRALDLAEPTVRNHVTVILKLMKATNRTEAVIRAGALGWELPRLDD